jgi:phosphoribosyl 1,2-cyclic phosphate phosphodiesterase
VPLYIMKLTFLGTGTSVGIPVIGCNCRICRSQDPRNKRRRSSLYVQTPEASIVIDTSLDFREQALAYAVPRVDAVLITHSHADHIFGLDDVRRYNTLQGSVIPVYGAPGTITDLRRIFNYVNVGESEPGVFRPRLDFIKVQKGFRVGAIDIEPLPVIHGKVETYGYRLEWSGRSVGYVPDCKDMPATTLDRFQGVDVMILDGLRHRSHPTHLTVEKAVVFLETIGARHSYLTHICHDLDHEETQENLPSGIFVSCDGMSVSL